MRLFVDTSTLFKKYIEEPGSAAFEDLLNGAAEIAVSPVTWIEMNAALERCREKRLVSPADDEKIHAEIRTDFAYLMRVVWNEALEDLAVRLIRKHSLRTLDAVQLASWILSEADLFVTSDEKLYREAKKAIRKAVLI